MPYSGPNDIPESLDLAPFLLLDPMVESSLAAEGVVSRYKPTNLDSTFPTTFFTVLLHSGMLYTSPGPGIRLPGGNFYIPEPTGI
jgi:hypothetical protein